MNRHWFHWWWLLLLIPVVAGIAHLHFDAEVLDLLPGKVPAVNGLKLYQQHFTNARELIVTVKAPDAELPPPPHSPSPGDWAAKPIWLPT